MTRKPTRTAWNTLLDDRPTSNVPRIKFSYAFSKKWGVNRADHLLDIGCGTGSYTRLIDRDGCIGVDLDINGLLVAKKYCRRSDFIVCSATSLPFRDNVFDYAFMWGVFEELPVGLENQAIIETRRILFADGKYLLSVYSDHVISKLFDPAFLFGAVRHYNATRFLKLLSDMGFIVSEYTIRGRIYTLMAVFLVYFYKHILHRKDGQIKRFIEQRSMDEISQKSNGIVYTFIAASRSP